MGVHTARHGLSVPWLHVVVGPPGTTEPKPSKVHPTYWLDVGGRDDRDPFHAIADPTRRLMLKELSKRDDQTLYELCVRILTDHGVDMTRQGIEKQLAVLEDAGIVRSERRGKYKVLRLDRDRLRKSLSKWLEELTENEPHRR